MGQNQTKSIDKNILQEDRDTVSGLKNIQNYNPLNHEFTVEMVLEAEMELDNAHELVIQLAGQLAAARDAEVAKQWHFHNRVLGAKDQIRAQFGKDSDELQSLGLKKVSEYRRRGGRASGKVTPP